MPRSVSAVSLLVPDYDDGIAFYVGKLGFTLIEDTPLGDAKRWVLVSPIPVPRHVCCWQERQTMRSSPPSATRRAGGCSCS